MVTAITIDFLDALGANCYTTSFTWGKFGSEQVFFCLEAEDEIYQVPMGI